MKKYVFIVTAFLLTLILTVPSGAELLDRENNLIYDDILDITWLQDANYSVGTLTWDDAIIWTESLVFQGYSDWRLPASDTSCISYDCTGSEMGHLYNYDNVTFDTPDIFSNVKSYMYWSADEYDPDPLIAWRFHFSTGYQGTSSKAYTRYAWAVRDGDSLPPAVPEPTGLILFLAGGLSLAGRMKKQVPTGPCTTRA